jgi:tetratricopeptide (TPR) repeat protein
MATATVSGRRLEALAGPRDTSDRLLYLPNGRYLKLASLGQAPLLADLIYIWAIQYYSNYDRQERFRYVKHVFGDVITELDPQFIDAYWIGALILIVEAKDLEGGLALFDQGIAANPDNWMLPYLAAWECALAGLPVRGAEYFERVAAIDGAPPSVRRMRAGMVFRAGDLDASLVLWQEILDDAGSDPTSRAIAEHKVIEVSMQIGLRDLREAVVRFRDGNGRMPRSLSELALRGYIPRVPEGPDAAPYRYDPRTGDVQAPDARVLGGAQ